MGFFDIAAQIPAVNVGIEKGMKLSELSREIAMKRDQAAADNLESQRRQADTAGLRLSPMDNMPGLPGNPDYLSQLASPSVTQIAAAAAPAGPSPAVAPFGPNNGGRISEAAQPGYEASLVAGEAALPKNRAGLTNTPGITQVDPNSSQLRQDINKSRAGWDIDSAVTRIQTKLATGAYGAGTSPLAKAWGYATDDAATRGVRADAVEAGSWWKSAAPAAYFRNNPDELAAATANPVKFYQDKVRDAVSTPPANVWSESTTSGETAAKTKAPADNTPAAQALADSQAKASIVPAAATGKPVAGQPLTMVVSAGLATSGGPSAAVAAEGATRFNMEIERVMNTRAVVVQNAKQQYDQNMFLANRAERDAQIARSVQNMAGYDAHMKNAITYRNQATSAHTTALDRINAIDATVQTNVLGFAVDRLTNLNDTTYISQAISAQTKQITAVRESGTLGADGKPTYNMWIQGESGNWTAVSDAKSGKPQPFSANEIAVRALSASSEAYRTAQSASNVEQAKATAALGREITAITVKSRADALAKIAEYNSKNEYDWKPNPGVEGSFIGFPKDRQNGQLVFVNVPPNTQNVNGSKVRVAPVTTASIP